jgi:GT2 family glycosyltransferase
MEVTRVHMSRPGNRVTNQPTLSVIVVNFQSWPDVTRLIQALASAEEVSAGRCELIVVDNASDDPPHAWLEDAEPAVRLILRDENGGFAAGVNAGWRASRGDWLLLLNPDVVADRGLIRRVLERVDGFARGGRGDPGIVGFGLRNPNGTPQPSVGVEPGLLRALLEPFLPRSRRKYRATQRARAGPAAWVTGACALVSTRAMASVGGMDEDFFLYYEEVALCRSIRASGRSVEFDPSIEVVHLRPLQNRPATPPLRVITRHSRLVYFKKHCGDWSFRAIAALTRAEALLREAWARARRRDQETLAWQSVARLARALQRGESVTGAQVRDIAKTVGEYGPRLWRSPRASWSRRAREVSYAAQR